MNPDPLNSIFAKAVAFVNQTNKHLFVTGKAGTGKTTFLKHIKENTFKRLAVVAPTGVAAINAGGVTIHSFVQLPFGPFVPSHKNYWNSYNGEMNNPATLLKNLRLPTAKRDVIRELDLLIIDEVSMVRADLLDAIDTVLRHVRRQPLLPFGGVQMVYIGDLYQLPPVVKNDEWLLLNEFYASPFFFSSLAVQQAFPLYIELKKIYRQKDDTFIHLLNNIRNNCCTADDLEYLHQYYQPDFLPGKDEKYITLTSHNGKADAMNQSELQKIASGGHAYEATITGDFHERLYPADKKLYLKTGAQVMLIKNDKGEARRYYNGKIAVIKSLEADKIILAFAGETAELELERETWRNIRYHYAPDKDQLEEEELGTFTQYPIRLAWAITIHKSQGLTFEKAIIDAGSSFAPGQVYVSLSRLTSLQGLVLRSKILPHTISTDERVVDFVQHEMGEEQLQLTLEEEQKTFVRHSILMGFGWGKVTELVEQHVASYEHRKVPEPQKSLEWCHALQLKATEQLEVAQKFRKQMEHLFTTCEADGYKLVAERTRAAAGYFLKEIAAHYIAPSQKHLQRVKTQPKVKKYARDIMALIVAFEHKKQQVEQALQLAEAMEHSTQLTEVLQLVNDQQKPVAPPAADEQVEAIKKTKLVKGESQRLSLQLFKKGKSIADIAVERNLAPTTVEGHLATFIANGEIDITDLVEVEKLDQIIKATKVLQLQTKETPVTWTAIKNSLPDDFTYGEIKAAQKYLELNPAET